MRRFVSMLLFSCLATGASSFSVTSSNQNVKVKENEGADLTCTYSADFGPTARVEWKFNDLKGSQKLVTHEGKPTSSYTNRVVIYNNNLRFSKVTRLDNGEYTCEVSNADSQLSHVIVKLTVLVPPSIPKCTIPQSATSGTSVLLRCHDPDSSPPPKHVWFKNGVLLPADPSNIAAFKNATYKLDEKTGLLEFPSVAKTDAGEYYCRVENEAGPAQSCKAMKMEVGDSNVGGIVAGVIILLGVLALSIFVVWFAKKKGYLDRKSKSHETRSNAVYQPTSMHGGQDDDDGDFKQKSSFVV